MEYAVNGRKLDGLPGKIFFAKKSGDHRNLHCGRGENWPDFYVWDDAINHWFAWLEFKHWGSSNIEMAKNFYKNHKYNARYVLVCLNDLTFHLIDYDTDTIIAQPNLKAPDNLLL